MVNFLIKCKKRRHRCFVFTKNGFIVKSAKIYLQLNAVSQLFHLKHLNKRKHICYTYKLVYTYMCIINIHFQYYLYFVASAVHEPMNQKRYATQKHTSSSYTHLKNN